MDLYILLIIQESMIKPIPRHVEEIGLSLTVESAKMSCQRPVDRSTPGKVITGRADNETSS